MRTGFVPIALMNSTTAGLKIASRSKTKYRGVRVVWERLAQLLNLYLVNNHPSLKSDTYAPLSPRPEEGSPA